MPFERDDIEASLRRKGFVEGGSDHRHFTYRTNAGQKTSVWTKTSHGSGYKTLSDHLVQLMARQCGLTRAQFASLVACPLTREAFERILIETGRIRLR